MKVGVGVGVAAVSPDVVHEVLPEPILEVYPLLGWEEDPFLPPAYIAAPTVRVEHVCFFFLAKEGCCVVCEERERRGGCGVPE